VKQVTLLGVRAGHHLIVNTKKTEEIILDPGHIILHYWSTKFVLPRFVITNTWVYILTVYCTTLLSTWLWVFGIGQRVCYDVIVSFCDRDCITLRIV